MSSHSAATADRLSSTTLGNQYSYGAVIGPLVRNVWYDFVYHVKWSWNSDGFFKAWVNGVQKLDHHGPTLYQDYGVYLKLANYHSAFGQSSFGDPRSRDPRHDVAGCFVDAT